MVAWQLALAKSPRTKDLLAAHDKSAAPQNGGADNSQTENAQVEKLLLAIEHLTNNMQEAQDAARSGGRRRRSKPQSAAEPLPQPTVEPSQTVEESDMKI